MPNPYTKPFLKWPGSKFRILTHLHTALPAGKRLIEPFVGSGAVFLNTGYSRYLLGDINPDLINLYTLIKLKTDDFICQAKPYFSLRYNTEIWYYRLRDEFNRTQDPIQKAILFLYLNRHTYNGLCRYNQAGEFNAPFGYYKKPYFPEREISYFAEKSQHAQFFCLPFEKMLTKARAGDVIYCDPPYVPLDPRAHFSLYTTKSFDLRSQHKLVGHAKRLAIKQLPVIVSNHNTAFTRQLYQQAKLRYFKARRSISCLGNHRHDANELLAVF